MPKRYLVSGATDGQGYPTPPIVVEIPDEKEELGIKLREDAQQAFKDGASPEEVAKMMGGTLAAE